jgi:dienelactone hydrolase
LGRQPGINGRRIVAAGYSRGGEGALLVGSRFPQLFHGVIGIVPSSQVNGAIAGGGAAWTYHGRPVTPYRPIPVERIHGPVLVAGAGDDSVWGSSLAVNEIEQRLVDHHFPFPQQHVNYPNVGHDLATAVPDLPQPDPVRWGGHRRATAAAKAALWKRMLTFLGQLR